MRRRLRSSPGRRACTRPRRSSWSTSSARCAGRGSCTCAEGTRIADALAAAGGVTAKADAALVNLAAPVADGEQVVVPARGAAGAAAAGAGGGGSSTAPVDLNTATPEQLDTLPGVGPQTAAKIISFRQEHGPFHSVEELDAVPGIGPARIEQLKGLVLP